MTKKILIADDDAAILDAVSLLLGAEGYEVLTAHNGQQVIPLLEKKPDLILLDIWMSGTNGQEVCTLIKTSPKTMDIPVILVSANNDTARLAQESGAEGFLLKPFEMEDLFAVAHRFAPLAS